MLNSLTSIGTFKEALHEDLRQSKVPAKQLCEEMGIALSTLYNMCNSEISDVHMKAKDLVYFAKRTNGRHAISFLNRCLDMVCIPLDELTSDPDKVEALMAANIGMFGEVLKDFSDAISDRKFTIDEAKQLERGIDALVGQLELLRESVNSSALKASVA